MKKCRVIQKMKIYLLPLCAAVTVTGCEVKEETIPESGTDTVWESESVTEKSDIQKTLQSYEVKMKEGKALAVQVAEYDLGSGEYVAQSGKTMPYQIRGVIAAPEGEGSYPLVLITHGSHSNEDESLRFDRGFTYLAEALAQNGYIAVSMDMSKPYIWKYGDNDEKEKSVYLAEEHMKLLEEAQENDEDWPVELAGKIDLSNIALIGHSRGGDIVFDIATDLEEKGKEVKAILSLAPALSHGVETKKWPDADVSILVAEYDGDVTTMEGFALQRILEDQSDRMSAAVLLMRANHNYFNTELTQNDALMIRSEEQTADQITNKEQQEFLVHYALDFLNASLKDQMEGTLYEAGNLSTDSMYGQAVMSRVKFPGVELLADMQESDAYSVSGCQVEPVTDSWFLEADEVIIDTVTYGQEAYKEKRLMHLTWEERGARLDILSKQKDISKKSNLVVNIVADAANDFNVDEYQRFTVLIKDELGNQCAVTLPKETQALRKTPGFLDMTPVFDKEVQFWSYPSPINSIRIPLYEFEGVDLTRVESVSLVFDQNDSGALYLESMFVG